MAVIKCPECHNEMSDVAEKCPNCGYPYAEKVAIYHQAMRQMRSCETEKGYKGLAELFRSVSGIYDSDEQVQVCLERAGVCHIHEIQRQEAKAKQKEEQAKQKQKLFRKLAILLVVVIIAGSICFKAYTTPKEISFNSVEEMSEALRGTWQTTFYDDGNVGHYQLKISSSSVSDRILPASQNGIAQAGDYWMVRYVTFYPDEGKFSVYGITHTGDKDYIVFSCGNELIIRETRYTNEDKDKWYHRYKID